MAITSKYSPRARVSFECAGVSLAKQQFAVEADVNRLIDRYKKTGSFYNPLSVQSGEARRPMYEDISTLPDLAETLETLQGAKDLFMGLPSAIREQFGNDVAAFVAWAQDVRNLPALGRLGIVDGVPDGAANGGDQPAPAVEAQEEVPGDAGDKEPQGSAV